MRDRKFRNGQFCVNSKSIDPTKRNTTSCEFVSLVLWAKWNDLYYASEVHPTNLSFSRDFWSRLYAVKPDVVFGRVVYVVEIGRLMWDKKNILIFDIRSRIGLFVIHNFLENARSDVWDVRSQSGHHLCPNHLCPLSHLKTSFVSTLTSQVWSWIRPPIWKGERLQERFEMRRPISLWGGYDE